MKLKRIFIYILSIYTFIAFYFYAFIYQLSNESAIRIYPNIYLGYKCKSFHNGVVKLKEGRGRLGNLIIEYVSIWSFANLYHLDGYVPDLTIHRLEQLFQTLSLHSISILNTSQCEQDSNSNEIITKLPKIHTLADAVQTAKDGNRIILLPAYVILVETIVHFFGKLKLIFHYKQKYHTTVQKQLSIISHKMQMRARTGRKQVIFVGIHARRTDFGRYMWKRYGVSNTADVAFYSRAMAWMRTALYQDTNAPVTIAFIVTSDDPKWSHQMLLPQLQQQNLSDIQGEFDVFYGGSGGVDSPEHDLVLLSSCNHSIFSYGTFGLWSALMTGGRTVMYKTVLDNNDRSEIVTPFLMFSHYLDTWTALS